MRLLFFGTPDFARTVLGQLLASRHEVLGCVTQPPRPSGRGLARAEPPAALLAREHGLPVFQPEKLHARAVLAEFAGLGAELFVTAAFGRLLRPALLDLPPRGCWNVHTSLLPRHRGASPASAAILAGDLYTGVSIFELDAGMDTGPLLYQAVTPIGAEETAGGLTDRLAELGARTLLAALDAEEIAPLRRRPQDEALATAARLLAKDDGRLRWNRPAMHLDRIVRAVTPWPGAFTFHGGKRLRIHRAVPLHEMREEAAPGTVVSVGASGIDVAAGPGVFRLLEVQSEGRARQGAAEWARGARLVAGIRFHD